jgi:hypothetical protein
MAKLKQSFPADLDYAVSLDTTLAVSEGMHDIMRTLVIALILVASSFLFFCKAGARRSFRCSPCRWRSSARSRFFPIFGFTEHAFALRFGAGDWAGGGRCHCGRRSHRTSHRGRHEAQGRRAQGHAGSGRPGRFARAHSRGGFYSDHFHRGHHRAALPAIRADNRHFRHAVRVQRPVVESCARGIAVKTERKK